jgi:putative transposase
MEKRNRYTAEFKTKIVLEVLREEQTLNQIAAKYELNPQMISQWKRQFLKDAPAVFENKNSSERKLKKELEEKESNYQKIVGQLSYEIDWLKHTNMHFYGDTIPPLNSLPCGFTPKIPDDYPDLSHENDQEQPSSITNHLI